MQEGIENFRAGSLVSLHNTFMHAAWLVDESVHVLGKRKDRVYTDTQIGSRKEMFCEA